VSQPVNQFDPVYSFLNCYVWHFKDVWIIMFTHNCQLYPVTLEHEAGLSYYMTCCKSLDEIYRVCYW